MAQRNGRPQLNFMGQPIQDTSSGIIDFTKPRQSYNFNNGLYQEGGNSNMLNNPTPQLQLNNEYTGLAGQGNMRPGRSNINLSTDRAAYTKGLAGQNNASNIGQLRKDANNNAMWGNVLQGVGTIASLAQYYGSSGTKAMNEEKIATSRQNRDNAQVEATALANYRKSYGA